MAKLPIRCGVNVGRCEAIGDAVAKMWDGVTMLGDVAAIGDVVAKLWDMVSMLGDM